MDGQGNLERTWKVREKSGKLKINGHGRQTSKNYLFCSRGEKMNFLMGRCKSISPFMGGYFTRKEFAPLGSKFFPLKITPKFEVIQLAPLNLRIKCVFFICQRV